MATTSYIVSHLLPPDFPPLNSALNAAADVIFVNYCHHRVMPVVQRHKWWPFSGMFFLFFLFWNVLPLLSMQSGFIHLSGYKPHFPTKPSLDLPKMSLPLQLCIFFC